MEKNMDDKITLAHGSGGEKYRELVREVFLPAYSNEYFNPLNDSAILKGGSKLAMTTDSYVVRPLFFPGGNIGSLAVSGTVNDLAVSGAHPEYISIGMIIEAGFETALLLKIVESITSTAREAGVRIVTGDTKVIENKGTSDGIYINTAGVGIFDSDRAIPPQRIEPGDRIIISGYAASHGMAVMNVRETLGFSPPIESDAAPLGKMIETVLRSKHNTIHAMRDPTRGGVAATLCEWASQNTDIVLYENALPVKPDVSAACKLLGLDPLFIANEGIILLSVPENCTESVLESLKSTEHGKNAVLVGEVKKGSGKVIAETEFGSHRRIFMPRGELLPRIC
jgi:hydrogenase expression/formation protein HypE